MSPRRGSSAPLPEITPVWHEPETQRRFLLFLEGTRKGWSRAKCCRRLGLKYGTVIRWLNPMSKGFIEEAHEAWVEARAQYLDTVEDMSAEGLVMARKNQESDVLIRGSLSVLERQRRSEWARTETRMISGEVIHKHQLPGVRAEAVTLAASISRALLGPAPTAIPEPDVVEGEVVEGAPGSLGSGLP